MAITNNFTNIHICHFVLAILPAPAMTPHPNWVQMWTSRRLCWTILTSSKFRHSWFAGSSSADRLKPTVFWLRDTLKHRQDLWWSSPCLLLCHFHLWFAQNPVLLNNIDYHSHPDNHDTDDFGFLRQALPWPAPTLSAVWDAQFGGIAIFRLCNFKIPVNI